jgi:hypothetical protein
MGFGIRVAYLSHKILLSLNPTSGLWMRYNLGVVRQSTAMTRITGPQLVALVDTLTAEGETRSNICRAAGYIGQKEDGSERLHFTAFYEALLEAKGGPEQLNNNEDDEWDYTHPSVDEEYMEIYNDMCDQYTQQAVDFFLTSWSDCDLRDFSYYYVGFYTSEADFAEEWYDDLEIPVVVDWQATWDCNLRHDFYFMSGYVFRNCI